MAFVGPYNKKHQAAYYRIKIHKSHAVDPAVRAEFQIFKDAAHAAAAKADEKVEPMASRAFQFSAAVGEADKKKAGYLAAKSAKLFSGLADA